ncbi:MAG: hypothetical protein ACLSCV_09045 [Acutalibacteraceae bacterium]
MQAYLSDNSNGKGFIGLIASGILDIYSVALDGRDTMLNSLHKGNCFEFAICSIAIINGDCHSQPYQCCCILHTKKYHCNSYGTRCSLAMKYALVCNKNTIFD